MKQNNEPIEWDTIWKRKEKSNRNGMNWHTSFHLVYIHQYQFLSSLCLFLYRFFSSSLYPLHILVWMFFFCWCVEPMDFSSIIILHNAEHIFSLEFFLFCTPISSFLLTVKCSHTLLGILYCFSVFFFAHSLHVSSTV